MVDAMAQRSATEAELIKLTGKISCYDPMNGTLASVVIYNINQGKGSISEEDGSFTIDMARTDTIVFSTAEHKDYSYVIEKDPDFIDHSIEVIMLTDAIWLDAVTIMGHQSLEQFKREILNLDIDSENSDLVLPIVSKYARQLSTGDGETDLFGPLTYLQNKFDRYYKMKRKVIRGNK